MIIVMLYQLANLSRSQRDDPGARPVAASHRMAASPDQLESELSSQH